MLSSSTMNLLRCVRAHCVPDACAVHFIRIRFNPIHIFSAVVVQQTRTNEQTNEQASERANQRARCGHCHDTWWFDTSASEKIRWVKSCLDDARKWMRVRDWAREQNGQKPSTSQRRRWYIGLYVQSNISSCRYSAYFEDCVGWIHVHIQCANPIVWLLRRRRRWRRFLPMCSFFSFDLSLFFDRLTKICEAIIA